MITITPHNVLAISTVTIILIILNLWSVTPGWLATLEVITLFLNIPLLIIQAKKKPSINVIEGIDSKVQQ